MRILVVLLIVLVCMTSSAINRGLIVGIGEYDTEKTGWEKLHGDKDVEILIESLKIIGFEESNIKTLKNNEATKKEIKENLIELLSKVQSGDNVIFHFSGHGQPVTDLNGDEENGLDEAIVPFDAFKTPRYKNGENFYQGENHLIDDELFPLFNEIKKKVGKSGYFLVTIDACYSRGIEMDALGSLTPEEQERTGTVRGTDHVLKLNAKSPLHKIAKPGIYSKIGKMAVVSACREDEQNFEYKNPVSHEIFGSLSYTLASLLKKGYTFQNIEKYFREKKYTTDKIFIKEQHPKIIVY